MQLMSQLRRTDRVFRKYGVPQDVIDWFQLEVLFNEFTKGMLEALYNGATRRGTHPELWASMWNELEQLSCVPWQPDVDDLMTYRAIQAATGMSAPTAMRIMQSVYKKIAEAIALEHKPHWVAPDVAAENVHAIQRT